MTIEDQIEAIWAEGHYAPYDLYEGTHFLDGYPILVEAIGGNPAPFIQRGELISAELAQRISKQIRTENDPAMLTVIEVTQ